jgi:hypothetical protein
VSPVRTLASPEVTLDPLLDIFWEKVLVAGPVKRPIEYSPEGEPDDRSGIRGAAINLVHVMMKEAR